MRMPTRKKNSKSKKNYSFEVEQASKIIECALIGDSFEADRYFHDIFLI